MAQEHDVGAESPTRSGVARLVQLVQDFAQQMRAPEGAVLRGERVEGLVYVGTAEDDLPAWVLSGLEVWDLCWGLARPALEDPESPPLNRRQYAVACFLAEGLGDEAIARRVGVSRRTVASDVRAVMDLLGAQTRFQAGIRLGSMKFRGRRP
ncbi:helix-turn-helix transcriptional regulator [Terracoccus luteus]|uniref:DNA-binding CsgD family transcriptional regulator n=1 Tax=Terracoccus luteus TaxID=53356 RepID=A0A839PRW8_9MICO|nr:helix-turn-helix transcriptional regulator [Terracoccus luteus]MBB2985813.1 DNA-binding CsgD family transcriptional regulator [Terracoccus luteus]MCP2171465.1 DNA-binding CsgD family transcriptional regulator [Terracoccus luteus]